MKRLLFIFGIGLLSLSASAQWDWGDDSGSKSSGGSSSTGGTKSGGSGSSTGGSGGGSPAPAAGAPAKIEVPTIGTHYDDAAESHYEPPHVPDDGRPSMDQATIVPYPYLREADVKFRRRVWRRIDTRQKMNKSFTWPKNPVTQIIYDLGVKGQARCYWSDSLNRLMTPEEAYKQGAELIVTQVQNYLNPDDGTDLVDTAYYDLFKFEKIRKFEILEDWIFDYKHSEFRPRIIAIAPLYPQEFNGITYETPLFWLKMDDIRPTLAKCEVYNRYNDAMRISWDDLFNHYRLFDSYIVKQTDWDDLYIAQKTEFMQDGLGALIEGENIKNDLFIFEHDLWEY